MEWKKGFLTAPPERKPKARKATALPDEAFLPAESYDIMDDEGDSVDPRIAELETSDEAYEYSVEYSRSHVNLYNQGMIKISADANMEFCEDIRVVNHNRKFFGHHDGPGKGGTQRNMLLPSGIVMHYIEWGAEAAPPIVMLHDISGCAHEFDEIARPLAAKYRVLVRNTASAAAAAARHLPPARRSASFAPARIIRAPLAALSACLLLTIRIIQRALSGARPARAWRDYALARSCLRD